MAEVGQPDPSISPAGASIESTKSDQDIHEVDDAYGIQVIEESMKTEDVSEEQIFATLRNLNGSSV
ncbi:MAG: hypothetical protein F4X94_05725 [Dehalococcoidia bacterium]|nr:hypothetical protein [Dehalococcoidia bacterium]